MKKNAYIIWIDNASIAYSLPIVGPGGSEQGEQELEQEQDQKQEQEQ